MPPEVKTISLPVGRGRDVVPFLESLGLVSRVPPIRSSDYEVILSNPFHYYLARRLGLMQRLKWSKALSRGSWTHKAFELDDFSHPSPLTVGYWKAWDDRVAELKVSCGSMGIVGQSRESILAREEKDAKCALAWYSAAASVLLPRYGSFRSFMAEPYWQILGREVRMTYKDPRYPQTPLVAMLDGLVYHRKHNTLWAVDLKTCEESPLVRGATCSIEFQTQHYSWVVQNLVKAGIVQAKFNLPPDVRYEGMMHLILQKPSIELSSLDRDCRLEAFTPTRGKNKGVTRMEKVYYGEPRLENYLARCKSWYLGEGDYSHLAEERKRKEVGPPVNISFSTDILDEEGMTEYNNRLSLIYDHATRPAYPFAFCRSTSALRQFGSLHPMYPFSVVPVADWAEVMEKDGFMIAHRDEEGVFTDGFDPPSREEAT